MNIRKLLNIAKKSVFRPNLFWTVSAEPSVRFGSVFGKRFGVSAEPQNPVSVVHYDVGLVSHIQSVHIKR